MHRVLDEKLVELGEVCVQKLMERYEGRLVYPTEGYKKSLGIGLGLLRKGGYRRR